MKQVFLSKGIFLHAYIAFPMHTINYVYYYYNLYYNTLIYLGISLLHQMINTLRTAFIFPILESTSVFQLVNAWKLFEELINMHCAYKCHVTVLTWNVYIFSLYSSKKCQRKISKKNRKNKIENSLICKICGILSYSFRRPDICLSAGYWCINYFSEGTFCCLDSVNLIQDLELE